MVETFGLYARELDYVDELLEQDVRNNSAWAYRFFIISHTSGFTAETVEQEIT